VRNGYVLELPEGRSDQPLSVQIAQAIAQDIARGRLAPGARLPGSRTLASMLGVHRNTVNAALAELSAQGWVESQPARGVFVRGPSPSDTPRPFARGVAERKGVPARTGFELRPQRTPPPSREPPTDFLLLTGGIPDPRLFPHAALSRAYRRVLRRRGARLLDYGPPYGEPSLRRALADMLRSTRGLACEADDVLITRGSQQSIWLSAHALLAPGDRVGVEVFGYPPAWEALRSTGATLVPLPLDHEGLRLDALEACLKEAPLRALYLTPHHQYPTMVTLSARRRLALLELARRHRFAILEDDYSNEFHYEGRPRLPLASADVHGHVVYIGGLSKILAPGLRIGYTVAPRPLLARMAALRSHIDRQGDATAEAAIAELMDEGEVTRHARRMRQVYMARREALIAALRREFGEHLSFDVPQGGMALWVRVHGVLPEAWAARARERGVLFRPGGELHFTRSSVPYVRMGFTRLDERELARAVREARRAFFE
jgi:GntR family transcriptional regulator/MocR family aminotransferase